MVDVSTSCMLPRELRNVRDIPETQGYHHQHFQDNVPETEMYDGDDVFTEWSSHTDMEDDQQTSTDDSTAWKFLRREDAAQEDIVDYINADTGDTVLQIGQDLRMPGDGDERVVANVEVLAVVDYCLYRRYLRQYRNNKREAQMQIERYYRILFSMVDQRFSTIHSPSLAIHVSLVGIVIPKNRAEASWLENSVVWPRTVRQGVVNVDTALQKFQMWLRGKYPDLPTYDHAVAFTGHRLYKGKRKVDGLAYIGTICRSLEGKSSSVVYDNGDFLAVGITTHELGHSLGATHDGDYLNDGCSANLDNIMSPRQSIKSKATTSMFYFSECSIKQMTLHLQTRRECLSAGTREPYNQVGNKSPGSIYGLTEQCQMVFGPKSDFCQRPGRFDNVCGQLWCTNPGNARICQTKSRLVALPGTICSHNKICHLGNCLEPSTIQNQKTEFNFIKPTASKECPTGDKDPAYCTFVAKKYGRSLICDHNLIGAYCCQTCSMMM
ncbi:ADAM family mig-17-like isoform X2 [Mizuhopecten yessoensis]|uniref:ADAM family mig-17-like isoform X2 n=1 Tax=Mizuhopecten yessoensis TaxID=6573 RepID=UPI000B45F091|nr:ADAM family mig-17-like isoform X2 [Mizuhopecten yessoensis]